MRGSSIFGPMFRQALRLTRGGGAAHGHDAVKNLSQEAKAFAHEHMEVRMGG